MLTNKRFTQPLLLLALTVALGLLSSTALAAPANPNLMVKEQGTRGDLMVTADVLLVRPVGAVMTAVGLAAFTASLPLTAINGSIDSTAEAWVRKPARNTFTRCLGCTPHK